MCFLAVLATGIERLLLLAWIKIDVEESIAQLVLRWIAFFLVSIVLYVFFQTPFPRFLTATKSAIGQWVHDFLVFISIVYFIIAIHFYIVLEITDNRPMPVVFLDVLYVVMVSSLLGVVWPLAFGLRSYARAARDVFLVSVIILGAVLLVLEPYLVRVVLADLGIVAPWGHLLLTGDFQSILPYLVPLPLILWSAVDGTRTPQAAS